MEVMDHGGRRVMETSWDHGQDASLGGNKCECTLKADPRELGQAQPEKVRSCRDS